MTRNAFHPITATPSRSSSEHAESLQVIEPGPAEQPAVRRFDLALFLELNEAYRARPLVPAPRCYDPETLASRGTTRARKLVDRFDLKGKSVLEIGCGHGEVARALAAEHGCRVVAIDIQPRADWAKPNGVDFLVADLTDGARSDLGEFDFIFASSVWEHVRHPYTMLERTKKLLAPHGVFQLSANLYRGPRASHRYREVFFPWPHLLFEDNVFEDFYAHIGMQPSRPAWVNYLTAAEYQCYFDLLGFSIQKLEYSITPLDREFYQRFEDRLSRYPIFDLERDFIHVVLTHRKLETLTPRPAQNSDEAAGLKNQVAEFNRLLAAAEEATVASQKQMQSKMKVLSRRLTASKEKQRALTQKARHLELRLERTRLRFEQHEKGLRSELGRAVEKSLRSPLGIFSLPLRIAKAYRRARKQAPRRS